MEPLPTVNALKKAAIAPKASIHSAFSIIGPPWPTLARRNSKFTSSGDLALILAESRGAYCAVKLRGYWKAYPCASLSAAPCVSFTERSCTAELGYAKKARSGAVNWLQARCC